jgi:hypothetical protein
MATVGQWLEGLFSFLGPLGTLVGLLVVFVADAAVVPTLPELAFVLAYSYRAAGFTPLSWAILLVSMALAGEAIGNTLLYLFVRRVLVARGHMPRILSNAMHRWTQFLVVRDERIILVNRVAPVVPFVGAFIAALGWSYPRSLAYILIGAAAKYSFLLGLIAFLDLVYVPATATLITVATVLVLVGVSLLASIIVRRRMEPRPGNSP